MNYEKRGSVARWENGTLIRVAECGIATEEGERFSCRPAPGERPGHVDASRVLSAARVITEMIRPPLSIERLVVSEVAAEHRVGEIRWSESHQRIHLSIVHGSERALVRLASLRPGEVAPVADTLARSAAGGRDRSGRIRLTPAVTAALLPSLAEAALPGAELWQAGGGIDGHGLPIGEVRIGRAPWPNWYRPSYRVRPVRLPLNLRLEASGREIDRSIPAAVAMLAEPRGGWVRVLVAAESAAWPATVRVVRFEAIGERGDWYPCGGGAYGAEAVVEVEWVGTAAAGSRPFSGLGFRPLVS